MYEEIKRLCKKNNISVRQLEKNLNLSTGSVSKWENSIPRADTLSKVANYLNVSMEYLLESLNGDKGRKY